MSRTAAIFSALALIFTASAAGAAPRGPTGVAAAMGEAAAEAPRGPPFAGRFDAAPALLWSVRLPGPAFPSAVHTELGGPALHGRYIYVGSAAADALFILERHSGRLVRRIPTGAPVQAQPMVYDNRLIFADTSGGVYAYALLDEGEGGVAEAPLWTRQGAAPVLSPVRVHADTVYLSTVDDVVVALNLGDGELKWRHTQRGDGTRLSRLKLYGAAAPAIAVGANGELEVVVGFSDGTLAGLDGESGVVRWQRRIGEGQYPDIIGGAAILGEDVIVAGYSEPLVAMHRGSRNVRWRLDHGGAFPPVVGGGNGAQPDFYDSSGPDRFVFHGGSDGLVRCVDGRTGALIWAWDSGTRSSMGQPVPTPAGLLVAAAAGTISLIHPADGQKLWSWQPGFLPSGFTGAIAVEGRQAVAVTNAGNLVSFVVPQEQPAWVAGDGLFDRVEGAAAPRPAPTRTPPPGYRN